MPWERVLSALAKRKTNRRSLVFSLACFTACLAIRMLFEPWLDGLKFITFYPGVAAAALVGGWRHGLGLTIAFALSAWYFFYTPKFSFEVDSRNTIVGIVAFLIVSGLITLLVAALREVINRLERANEDLTAAKLLQEDLFRELQHRVANNLQIVSAMLLDARRKLHLGGDAAAKAVEDAEARIWAMARLNRKLYDVTAAERLAPLIEETLTDIFKDLSVHTRVVVPHIDLSIQEMTAVVLLVSEAATNASKHVFSKGLGRSFEVTLQRLEDGRLQLLVRDDGPGIAQSASQSQRQSLGMSIMQAFAKQLGGSLRVAGPPGTTLEVDFNPREPRLAA
jgi:two-component sensor histidine kinase